MNIVLKSLESVMTSGYNELHEPEAES